MIRVQLVATILRAAVFLSINPEASATTIDPTAGLADDSRLANAAFGRNQIRIILTDGVATKRRIVYDWAHRLPQAY